MKIVQKSVAADFNVHPFGGILRGAKAKSVKTQGIFIIAAGVIFSSGIKLTKKQLPVIALLVAVPIHRAAAAEILHLYGTVLIPRYRYLVAIAGSRFVNGVGYNLKNRMLAALYSVRTEYNRRALSYSVCAFKGLYAFVSVFLAFLRHAFLRYIKFQNILYTAARIFSIIIL